MIILVLDNQGHFQNFGVSPVKFQNIDQLGFYLYYIQSSTCVELTTMCCSGGNL